MVNQKPYSKENYLKNFIDFTKLSHSAENSFPLSLNNESIQHKLIKFTLACKLRDRGHTVIIEAVLKNGLGRPDIVSIDQEGNGYIWEIINTEKKESINKKIDNYPIDFDLNFIYCNKPLEEQIPL